MQAPTPSKRPLNERNQNIVFTPFTPGQVNPSPRKRRYTKSARLTFDTPTPSGSQACTPSRPGSNPSRLEETLTDVEPDGFSTIPTPLGIRQHRPTFTNTIEPDTPIFLPNSPSESDTVLKDVNNYLQSCGWSLWRYLEALFSSCDQQISSSVSRLLLTHGSELLDGISKKKPDVVKKWAQQQVLHDLKKEGARIVSELLPPYGSSLSDLLDTFSLTTLKLRTKACAPLLWDCLSSAGTVHDDPLGGLPRARRNHEHVFITVVCMLAQARSERANIFQSVMGFWLLANGASRSVFAVLHHAGICVSYSTVTRHLRKLANERLSHVQDIAKKKPFLISWDNLCLRRDVAEQRAHNKSVFLSGTTVSIIELFGLELGELRASMLPPRKSRLPTMTFEPRDLLPNEQQSHELEAAFLFHVVDILFDFFPSLKARFKDNVKPPVVLPIPVHKTNHHSLPYLTINEATLDGTMSILQNVIQVLLRMDTEDLQRQGLILCSGDLLTWALTDRACASRRCDTNLVDNLSKWADKFLGLFHVKMAGARMIGNEYWGKPNGRTMWSLWKVNTLLCRKPMICGWKASKHAPFQPLCELMLTFALPANVLDGWRLECGSESLKQWVSQVNALEDITEVGKRVLQRIASRRRVFELREQPEEDRDYVLENVMLFNQDALILKELRSSIREGDIGRVVNVLSCWMVEFRGTGSMPKYADALFETLTKLKQMDPIRRKAHLMNWLVNLSGKPGHFKELDLLQEHENYYIKVIYQARGVNKNDDWLRVVSLCLWSLRSVILRVNQEYDTPYNGTSHTSPTTRNDVEKLMDYLKTHKIQSYTQNCPFNDETSHARDFFSCGAEFFDKPNAFKSFSRDFREATFGKKRKAKKTTRSCAVSDPESEDELEGHRTLSGDEDEDEDDMGDAGNIFNDDDDNASNVSDEYVAKDISAEEEFLYGIEDEDLYEDEATIGAIRDIVRNLAQVEDL